MKEKKYVTRKMNPVEVLECKARGKYKLTGISKKKLEDLAREYFFRCSNHLYAASNKRRDIEFMNNQAEGRLPFDQEFVLDLCKWYEDSAYLLLEPLFDEFIYYIFAPDGDFKDKPLSIRRAISMMHNDVKKAKKRLKERNEDQKM